MTTKVAVIGAAGRMGATACEAVEGADDLELVGRYDEGDELDDLGGAEVVIEFTVLSASERNVRHCVERGVHVVVGTSGWTDDKASELRAEVEAKGGVGVLIAPNFAIGAVLMMQFAKQAARFYESVEVVELHHPRKVDAPSGTATRTAELIATSRADAGRGAVPDATTQDPDGARGASVEGVPVHAVRLRGLVAHQEVLLGDDRAESAMVEVLLGNEGEMLTIRHDSFDRVSFMPGVLTGVRAVASHPGVTVGLEHVLGI